MKTTVGTWLAAMAMACTVLPVQAADPATHPGNVTDVALAAQGDLTGTIVNEQGQPLADMPVQIVHDRKVVAMVKSDATGRYSVKGLRGGLHMVRTVNNQTLCRFWNAGAAPPAASRSLTLTSSSTVVRGQYCGDGCGEDCGECCSGGHGGRGLCGGRSCGLFGGGGGLGSGGGALIPVVAIGAIAAVTIATTSGNNDERPVFAMQPASP
ncbi:MAG: carboxypeptidase-like regulatory domain-containing protein [Planctomycetaceae bacterium]